MADSTKVLITLTDQNGTAIDVSQKVLNYAGVEINTPLYESDIRTGYGFDFELDYTSPSIHKGAVYYTSAELMPDAISKQPAVTFDINGKITASIYGAETDATFPKIKSKTNKIAIASGTLDQDGYDKYFLAFTDIKRFGGIENYASKKLATLFKLLGERKYDDFIKNVAKLGTRGKLLPTAYTLPATGTGQRIQQSVDESTTQLSGQDIYNWIAGIADYIKNIGKINEPTHPFWKRPSLFNFSCYVDTQYWNRLRSYLSTAQGALAGGNINLQIINGDSDKNGLPTIKLDFGYGEPLNIRKVALPKTDTGTPANDTQQIAVIFATGLHGAIDMPQIEGSNGIIRDGGSNVKVGDVFLDFDAGVWSSGNGLALDNAWVLAIKP